MTELRALGATLPIIMVTTEAQKGQVIKAIQAGVTDYLTKPFDNEVIQSKPERYVPNGSRMVLLSCNMQASHKLLQKSA